MMVKHPGGAFFSWRTKNQTSPQSSSYHRDPAIVDESCSGGTRWVMTQTLGTSTLPQCTGISVQRDFSWRDTFSIDSMTPTICCTGSARLFEPALAARSCACGHTLQRHRCSTGQVISRFRCGWWNRAGCRQGLRDGSAAQFAGRVRSLCTAPRPQPGFSTMPSISTMWPCP